MAQNAGGQHGHNVASAKNQGYIQSPHTVQINTFCLCRRLRCRRLFSEWSEIRFHLAVTLMQHKIEPLHEFSIPWLLQSCWQSGLKRICVHDLSHSCASLLYAHGVSLKDIQEWLGHSTISTTANIYTHLDYSSKEASANAILDVFPTR